MDTLIQSARKRCVKATTTGLNSLIITKKDGQIVELFNRPCLNGITFSDEWKQGIKTFMDWPFHRLFRINKFKYKLDTQRKYFNKKEKTYLTWLVNESVWNKAYLTKDIDEWTKLAIVFNTDLPANYIIQADILLRISVEFPKIIHYWNIFRKYGDPHYALYFAHSIYSIDRYHFGVMNNGYGHRSLSPKDTQNTLRARSERDFSKFKNFPSMRNSCPYNIVASQNDIWDQTGNRILYPEQKKIKTTFTFGTAYPVTCSSNSQMKTQFREFIRINNG